MLKRAGASGHPECAPRAGYILAELLRELLHIDEAKAAYEFVAGSDHPLAAMAAAGLGDLLHDQGELPGARAAYLKAAGGDGLLIDPAWAWSFGNALGRQHETGIARTVFVRIIESGGSHAPEAAKSLGDLLHDQGDKAAAGAAGKITIVGRSTFFNWGNPAIEIDEIGQPFTVGTSYAGSASVTHDVTPGPHVITGDAKNKGAIIVDVPPGKEVRVQCTPGRDAAYFSVLG
jgi:Tetratricopeptide repeat